MVLENLEKSTEYIRSRSSIKPKVGVILGSGLGAFAKTIRVECEIPYSEIPAFTPPTVEGHSGALILGYATILQEDIHENNLAF